MDEEVCPEKIANRRLMMHRLLVVMRLGHVDNLLRYMFESPEEGHLHPAIARKLPMDAQCTCRLSREAIDRRGVKIFVRHLSATRNSRRFIHVALMWISIFGPNYPFDAPLLDSIVWKSLICICDNGVKDKRGHLFNPRAPTCIAPYHYRLPLTPTICKVLFDEFHTLEEDINKASTWSANLKVSAFMEKLSTRVREVEVMPFPQMREAVLELLEFVRRECPPFPGRSYGANDAVPKSASWNNVVQTSLFIDKNIGPSARTSEAEAEPAPAPAPSSPSLSSEHEPEHKTAHSPRLLSDPEPEPARAPTQPPESVPDLIRVPGMFMPPFFMPPPLVRMQGNQLIIPPGMMLTHVFLRPVNPRQ